MNKQRKQYRGKQRIGDQKVMRIWNSVHFVFSIDLIFFLCRQFCQRCTCQLSVCCEALFVFNEQKILRVFSDFLCSECRTREFFQNFERFAALNFALNGKFRQIL